jgi:gluconokinase
VHKVIFITGVSGSGKTTIGKLLAQKTGFAFYDADDFHPQQNINKMKAGKPLTDEDRLPWLDNLHHLASQKINTESIIIACSALKQVYRKRLSKGIEASCRWVFLKGSYATIQQRMQQRKDHYMPAALLQSQFDALELPADAIEAAIEMPPETIVSYIITAIR